MKNFRWQWLPLILVAIGVFVVWGVALVGRAELGALAYGLWAGGLLALAGAYWFRRPLSDEEARLQLERQALAELRAKHEQECREFETLQQKLQAELKRQAARIDAESRRLADKLIASHEWVEYPQPIDLTDAEASEAERAHLASQDRRVIELLEAESKKLYENIRQNKYAQDGKFQAHLLRDDAHALITQVARIYRPGVENPLLETSIEQLARATSRACFHLLIVMERLPLNVKEYNLNNMYGYIRQAIRGYGAYKSAEPFLGYLNQGYYLGRYLLGSSPVMLGAFWLAGQLSKHGAKSLLSRVLNRQAVELLHSAVCVIGFEIAAIYGGDFRHRDANWMYGAELTDLMSRFPISRENLAHALKEVGALQLRNEYDRVYLYRCLAEHQSADLRLAPTGYLTREERRQIVDRLAQFFDSFIHGKTADRVAQWKAHVEDRYHVKPELHTHIERPSASTDIDEAVRSLAGFLLAIKQRKVDELPSLLSGVRLLSHLNDQQRTRLFQDIQANPPFELAPPDIDPSGDLMPEYLADLAVLAVRTPPFDATADELLLEFAAYFLKNTKTLRDLLDRQYVEFLAENMGRGPATKKLTAPVARAVFQTLKPEEQPRFLYPHVSLHWPGPSKPAAREAKTQWLLGSDARLVVLAVPAETVVVWTGPARAAVERVHGYLVDDCRLIVEKDPADPTAVPPVISVSGAMTVGYDAYFKPLLAHFAQRPDETVEAE